MKSQLFITLLLLSAHSVASQCFINEPQTLLNEYEITDKFGNPYVDKLFQNQNNYLMDLLGLRVITGYYNDSQTGPNAFAIPPRLVGIDGETYFGVNLIAQYLSGKGAYSEYYVLWILAHEYAHIIQYTRGGTHWNETKLIELQADFIAGSITSNDLYTDLIIANNQSSSFNQATINRIMVEYVSEASSFFGKLGDVNIFNPDHHGLPFERTAAFEAGLSYGFASILQKIENAAAVEWSVNSIWNASVNFIREKYPR